MLDPKVAGLVTRELEKESVVVFDEGHNIDNICIEAMSVQLDGRKLDAAQRCVQRLSRRVDEVRVHDAARVRDESPARRGRPPDSRVEDPQKNK